MKNKLFGAVTVLASALALSQGEIVIEGGKSQDGNFFQIEFDTDPGWLYGIQEAEIIDGQLTQWTTPSYSYYYGIGQSITHYLAELPKNDGSPPVVDPSAPVPENTTFHIRHIESGAGSLVRWRSKDTGEDAEFVLWGKQLPELFAPLFVYTVGNDRFYIVRLGEIPDAELPNPEPLGTNDAIVFSTFVAEWQNIIDAEAAGMPASPPNPAFQGAGVDRGFFRVARFPIDTDSDGINDNLELEGDTDPFDWDTDGDGIDDGADGDPTTNAALANPDGENLPAHLDLNLLGRWDFESGSFTGFPRTAQIVENLENASFPAYMQGVIHGDGMVSKCGDHTGFGYTVIDGDILQGNENQFSLSFWFRFDEGFVASLPDSGVYKTIWAISTTNPAGSTAEGNTLSVRQVGGQEEWYVGAYSWALNGGQPSSSSPGLTFTRPNGATDDGGWHHIAIVRNSPNVQVFIDGQQQITGSAAFNGMTFQGLAFPMLSVSETPFTFCRFFETNMNNAVDGALDRVRVYDIAISSADVDALFKQDIDRDGLWDFTESRSLLWRDANSDGIRTFDETEYAISPFYWDPSYADHDGDGLTSLLEQNVTNTNAAVSDSDGDLLPDGWEDLWGLDPNDGTGSNGKDGDPEGDQVTNLEEFINQSDPTSSDSDGDGTDDKTEIDQGSHPGDDRDGGAPIPVEDRLTLKLGIGDRSGSESEDYILRVFRIHPTTGVELPYHVHRSGGVGEYSELVYTKFWKTDTYTFQIDWQRSSGDVRPENPGQGVATEGPDFDYHFVVEPQGTYPGVILDSLQSNRLRLGYQPLGTQLLDPEDVNPQDDDDDDVAETQREFEINYEGRRVVYLSYDIEEVRSDQIAGNTANSLPTSYYGGEPNNPMLMGTRTDQDARIAIKVSTPEIFASVFTQPSVFAGVRRLSTAVVDGSKPVKVDLGETEIAFEAINGAEVYEVVAGYDMDGDQVLSNAEANVVFQRTPKLDKGGGAYSGGDAGFVFLDKIIVVTRDDSTAGRVAADGYGSNVVFRALVPNACDLLHTFSRGTTSTPNSTATTPGILITSSGPKLSHPVGAEWDSANEADTFRVEFDATTGFANQLATSDGVAELIDRAISANKAAILATAPSIWTTSSPIAFTDENMNFQDSDAFTDLHVGLGKCDAIGSFEIVYRSVTGTTLEVQDVKIYGYVEDLYDWAHGASDVSIAGQVFASPRECARAQAGHATLTDPGFPDAGRVFYTRVHFNTGWNYGWNKTY